MLNQPWVLGSFEKFLWAAQILLILAVLLRGRLDWAERLRRPSVSTCLTAVLMAWIVRLAYGFVLMSGGFWYYVPDDPCRWSMARLWSEHPFLVTWDAVWVGGSFYLHGLPMFFIDDPLLASKFVSVMMLLLPLAGGFVYVQGLFGNRWLSCAAVLLQAPLWFFILLGTGTMTELPMTGFLLGGGGLTLLGLRATRPAHRHLYLAGAILAFNAATAMHYVAWMMLAAVLAALLIFALSRRERRIGWPHWLAFAILSTLYCALWFTGCWIKFGQPLAFMENQITANLKYMNFVPFLRRLIIYPWFLGFSLSGVLPLTAFGCLWCLFSRRAWTGRVRMALLALTIGLCIMIATAIKGSTNATPYRSLTPLTVALMPMALAPLCLRRRDENTPGKPTLAGQKFPRTATALAALPCMLLLALYPIDNHKKTFSRQRLEGPTVHDAVAVGAWLRQDVIARGELTRRLLDKPVRLWLSDPQQIVVQFQTIEYLSGLKHGITTDMTPFTPDFAALGPDQMLITNKPVSQPFLDEITAIGSYHVYCRNSPASADPVIPALPQHSRTEFTDERNPPTAAAGHGQRPQSRRNAPPAP